MDPRQQIELFTTLFYICLAITAAGFSFSIFTFIKYKDEQK